MQRAMCCLFVMVMSAQSGVASTQPPLFCVENDHFLGSIERVSFTAFDMQIDSRVDTGARRSSLHAKSIQLIEEGDQRFVQFYAIDDLGHAHKMKEKLRYISEITNTSGISEKRFVIRTFIVLKNKKYSIDVNLKDRSNMQYKFLIGRDLLKKGGYLVKV
ncbi:MAG: ATP-dependent zinc protease [Legionella sp.]|nr:ATP-dependent zinc protease [Legionella sp.]